MTDDLDGLCCFLSLFLAVGVVTFLVDLSSSLSFLAELEAVRWRGVVLLLFLSSSLADLDTVRRRAETEREVAREVLALSVSESDRPRRGEDCRREARRALVGETTGSSKCSFFLDEGQNAKKFMSLKRREGAKESETKA